jgi:hypothetical protein
MIVPSLSFGIQQSGGGNKIGNNLSLLQKQYSSGAKQPGKGFLV